MLQMTGMVVNIYTKEGGTDKEGKPLNLPIKCKFLVLLICQMGNNKMN